MLSCSSSSFSGFVVLLKFLESWLMSVVRPLLMSVSVVVDHACLSCCLLLCFVVMCLFVVVV